MQNQGYRLRAYIKSKLRTLQNLVIKMDLLDNINNIMILLLSHNSKRMDYLVFFTDILQVDSMETGVCFIRTA